MWAVDRILLLTTSLIIISGQIQNALANSFTVSGAAATTNDGNTVDGNDSITVTSSGTVMPPFANSGLSATGNNSTLANFGTITTTGNTGYGICSVGDDDTITNSGTVTSALSYSIKLSGNNATLNLLEGSVLYGDVSFGNTPSAILNFGRGLSAFVETSSGIPNTINAPNNSYVVVGNAIYVANGTGFSSTDTAAFVSGGLVQNALNGRDSGTAFVASENADGKHWSKEIRSILYDNGRGTTAAYVTRSDGFAKGTDHPDGIGSHSGLVISQTDTVNSSSLSVTSVGAFGGLNRRIGGGSTEFSLTCGYLNNQSNRQVANNTVVGGIETASASYGALMLSPSINMPGVLGFAGSLVSVRYMGLYTTGYSETGTAASNLTVAGRMSHLVEARGQLSNSLSERTTLRYGLDGRYASADAASYTLAGSSLSATNANNGFSGRAYLGLDFARGAAASGSLELGLSSTGQADAGLSFKAEF